MCLALTNLKEQAIKFCNHYFIEALYNYGYALEKKINLVIKFHNLKNINLVYKLD